MSLRLHLKLSCDVCGAELLDANTQKIDEEVVERLREAVTRNAVDNNVAVGRYQPEGCIVHVCPDCLERGNTPRPCYTDGPVIEEEDDDDE